MLAHEIKKSNIGIFGFDFINLFTNDEIFCTGFTPDAFQVDQIGALIKRINDLTYSKSPICLYITHKNGLFWMDLKILCLGEPLFADSQSDLFSRAVEDITKKIVLQIPRSRLSRLETFEAAVS